MTHAPVLRGLVLLMSLALALPVSAAPEPKAFATAEEAAAALAMAAQQQNEPEILAILGLAAGEWIQSGAPSQDGEARQRFAAVYAQKHAVKPLSDGRAILEIGAEEFPFPFPLVRGKAGWSFDPEAGKEELLNRRIGENELTTIETLRAIVDAQFDYASEDRDGDGLREYAAKFQSIAGLKDGLFWRSSSGAEPSPVGELLALAADEGQEAGGAEPIAHHGYRFRILTRQAADADDHAIDYELEGGLLGGFAVLAYPARYGISGVMSFLINHEGAVYEADLGPETEREARAIAAFTTAGKWRRLADDPAL